MGVNKRKQGLKLVTLSVHRPLRDDDRAFAGWRGWEVIPGGEGLEVGLWGFLSVAVDAAADDRDVLEAVVAWKDHKLMTPEGYVAMSYAAIRIFTT